MGKLQNYFSSDQMKRKRIPKIGSDFVCSLPSKKHKLSIPIERADSESRQEFGSFISETVHDKPDASLREPAKRTKGVPLSSPSSATYTISLLHPKGTFKYEESNKQTNHPKGVGESMIVSTSSCNKKTVIVNIPTDLKTLKNLNLKFKVHKLNLKDKGDLKKYETLKSSHSAILSASNLSDMGEASDVLSPEINASSRKLTSNRSKFNEIRSLSFPVDFKKCTKTNKSYSSSLPVMKDIDKSSPSVFPASVSTESRDHSYQLQFKASDFYDKSNSDQLKIIKSTVTAKLFDVNHCQANDNPVAVDPSNMNSSMENAVAKSSINEARMKLGDFSRNTTHKNMTLPETDVFQAVPSTDTPPCELRLAKMKRNTPKHSLSTYTALNSSHTNKTRQPNQLSKNSNASSKSTGSYEFSPTGVDDENPSSTTTTPPPSSVYKCLGPTEKGILLLQTIPGKEQLSSSSPVVWPSRLKASENSNQQGGKGKIMNPVTIKKPGQSEQTPRQTNGQGNSDNTPQRRDDFVKELIEIIAAQKVKITSLEKKLNGSKPGRKPNKDFNVELIKDNDRKIHFYTGFPSYKRFKDLFNKVLKPKVNKLSMNSKARKGTWETRCSKKPGPKRRISLLDEFLLTMMKLRLNLPEEDLAYRFGLHQTSVSRTLSQWLPVLSSLNNLIRLPNKEKIPQSIKEATKGVNPVRLTINPKELDILLTGHPSFSQSHEQRNMEEHFTESYQVGHEQQQPPDEHFTESQQLGHEQQQPLEEHFAESQQLGHEQQQPPDEHFTESQQLGHEQQQPTDEHFTESQQLGHEQQQPLEEHFAESQQFSDTIPEHSTSRLSIDGNLLCRTIPQTEHYPSQLHSQDNSNVGDQIDILLNSESLVP